MWNFKMSQLPYFLSDFGHFCTNLQGNFYSFFWNYGNSGLDFPFKLQDWHYLDIEGVIRIYFLVSLCWVHNMANL